MSGGTPTPPGRTLLALSFLALALALVACLVASELGLFAAERTSHRLTRLMTLFALAATLTGLFAVVRRGSRREQALLQQLQFYRQAVDAAEVGVWRRPDADRTDMQWSEQLKALLRVPPDAEPVPLLSLVRQDHRQVLADQRDALLKQPAVHQFQAPVLCGDGRYRWFSVNAASTRDPSSGRISMAGTFVDIDAHHEVKRLHTSETALAQTVAELTAANADLARFTHLASHDLQEPLRMVSSFVTLLQEEYADQLDEQARDYIGFAFSGARRMQHMVDDLQDYARASNRPMELTEFDLRACVAGVGAQLARTGADGCVTYSGIGRIMADAPGLERVLEQLINNGFKYAGPGVSPQVKVQAWQDREAWHLSVADNGIGIDPAHHREIFVPFRRLHGDHEFSGTGIGLALVHKIITSWRGKIAVDSRPGHGSTFTLTIPRAEASLIKGAA